MQFVLPVFHKEAYLYMNLPIRLGKKLQNRQKKDEKNFNFTCHDSDHGELDLL